MNGHKISPAIKLLVVALIMGAAWVWCIDRVYVPPGHSLWLQYKGPLLFGSRQESAPGQFAEGGQVGVLPQLLGPGRHFYNPIWYQRNVVPDVLIRPLEVAVLTSKLGEELPVGEFLVDGDPGETKCKGVLRKVLGPGRYRLHPFAYDYQIMSAKTDPTDAHAKQSGWVNIDVGYVGVVTNQTDIPSQGMKAGIQPKVLPPGLYLINPKEQQVDIVGVGYWATEITVAKKKGRDGKPVLDESGEPIAESESGIAFPSNDGFRIQLDFSAIWGVMPDQAPHVVATFGSTDAVEQKVILPQSESICRNHGSKMGAVELLVGNTRQKFQDEVSQAFQKVLVEKKLELLYGLVRHIYIPQEVRIPIQNGYIADELKLTRQQETKTATAEATYRKAERTVELETETTRQETMLQVATNLAEGQKKAQQVAAETSRRVAEIEREVAEIEAKKTVLLGEAKAKAEQLQSEARSGKFQLAVEAFGSGEAYNKWQFAEGLPATIDLQLFYAGQGTLWTDLKNITPTLPLESQPAAKPTKPAKP